MAARATVAVCCLLLLLATQPTPAAPAPTGVHQFPFQFAITGPLGAFLAPRSPCRLQLDALTPGVWGGGGGGGGGGPGWRVLSTTDPLPHNDVWDLPDGRDYRVSLVHCSGYRPTPQFLHFTTAGDATRHRRPVPVGAFVLVPAAAANNGGSGTAAAAGGGGWRRWLKAAASCVASLGGAHAAVALCAFLVARTQQRRSSKLLAVVRAVRRVKRRLPACFGVVVRGSTGAATSGGEAPFPPCVVGCVLRIRWGAVGSTRVCAHACSTNAASPRCNLTPPC